jgi:transcriptional regulator
MLVRPSDAGTESEWRAFLVAQRFGHLIAPGRDRIDPVVVPTQFVLVGDVILTHLARPNPVWEALAERPRALLSVAGDWAYIPSDWKVVGAEDPRAGIPTTYYAAVQVAGPVTVVDEPDGIAGILRTQLSDLQPSVDVMDPAEHEARLRAIRGLRVEIETVQAKFKYGGNVDVEHRLAVADRLEGRGGPGDLAAARHTRRRSGGATGS